MGEVLTLMGKVGNAGTKSNVYDTHNTIITFQKPKPRRNTKKKTKTNMIGNTGNQNQMSMTPTFQKYHLGKG